jgi:hypothetical protein
MIYFFAAAVFLLSAAALFCLRELGKARKIEGVEV